MKHLKYIKNYCTNRLSKGDQLGFEKSGKKQLLKHWKQGDGTV